MSDRHLGFQPYHLALLAYPSRYRYEHGAEMVDAAQELSGKAWSIRESASFIIGGLRTRGLIASQQGPRSVWAAGIRVALLLLLIPTVSGALAVSLGITGDMTFDNPHLWLRAIGMAAICLSLTITTRWPTALIFSAIWLVRALSDPGEVGAWGSIALVAVLLWWLALRTDGRRAMSPWVTAGILTVLLAGHFALNSPFNPAFAGVLLLGPILVGVLLTTIDPRPLIVGVTTWVLAASWMVPASISFSDSSEWKYVVAPLAIAAFGIGLSRFSVRRVASDRRTH